jgi:outer membrane protein assembly factor BamB/tetratricopeptide (TPR) repeat protein
MKHAVPNPRAFRSPASGVRRLLAALALLPLAAAAAETNAASSAPVVADPFDAIYRGYQPVGWGPSSDAEAMKLSSEKSFYTLNLLPESERANALVKAAADKEQERQFGEAMEIYQKVIDEYPDDLFRVSDYGIFVPITAYCQLRLLGFPADALQQYRVKHDARARDAYDMAARKNSLEGLADVRDRMLATSFGAPALITLGYSALDRGHYLEALEYFETVWKHYPEVHTQNPLLASSVALCRKMLGQGADEGEGFGLVGHWKLDDGSGSKVADASGLANDGTAAIVQNWTQGKLGGAYHFDTTNAISIPSKSTLALGVGGSDYTIAFWLLLEEYRPCDFFAKRGRSADDMIGLALVGKGQVGYSLATQSPKWETGTTKEAIPLKRWTHVAFVKAGEQVRLFLDGRLDLRETLQTRVMKSVADITLGNQLKGAMDDVRVYTRALANREVAELAGTAGAATLQASTAAGEAPLTVEFSAPGAAGECRWEFGDGATATGPKVKHAYGRGGDFTALLTVTAADGRIAVARRQINVKWKGTDAPVAKRMDKVLDDAKAERPDTIQQLASAPNVTADDYLIMPPSTDPLGLTPPVWNVDLPGTRLDSVVYVQPVVTKQSVIFRHKNIVYCYSLLSGQLRWKNDLGGRVTWQNWEERQYPQEDILVQDGIVFTPMSKVGPTLVAIDEVTGQLKWAYGPMVATTADEANMRFETAPAGGPRSVFAGYVQDNIEGQTHTDTEYGVIAFESTTGRILWRREICRLRPGKFSAGFAVRRRNRVRSFLSPPLYQEGTVYYGTDAGAVAALDALSGRIKWVMRYPYYPQIHDSTIPFARGGGCAGHSQYPVYSPDPMLWYNQRPLLVGDDLYVLPVDAEPLLKLDRRTGKLIWQKNKGEGIQARRTDGGWAYFLGPTADGDLAITYSFRQIEANWAGPYVGGGVHLIDPVTGKTTWELGDWVRRINHPFLTMSASEGLGADYAYVSAGWPQMIVARPFLSTDGRLTFMSAFSQGWPHHGWEYNIAVVDLPTRKIAGRRRYISSEFIKQAEWSIVHAPEYLKKLESIPVKDDRVKYEISTLQAILERNTVPPNDHPPFLPFARVTAERFGTTFEVRMGARTISMVYDKAKVVAALAGRTDPDALFAQAELAVADGRLIDASKLIQQCLAIIPAEDADFRTMLNQLLYPIHKELARAAARAGKAEADLANCVGMSQTVGTLADEMESQLALSESYERRGDWKTAGQIAKSLVSRYGQYEYATASLLLGDTAKPEAACREVLDNVAGFTARNLYAREIGTASSLLKKGLGLYFGALSPLNKDLKVRAGELGALRLIQLQQRFPALKQALDKEAGIELPKQSADEQVARLWEYAGTPAAQKFVDQLGAATEKEQKQPGLTLESLAALRKRQWALADAARICSLKLPDALQGPLLAPRSLPPPAALGTFQRNRTNDLDEERGPAWLVLERGDPQQAEPDRLFLGGRVKKKFDNKFLLYCLDQKTGKVAWKAQEQRGETWFDEIRLFGKGDEPGFCEAFVHQDVVVVHGLYDVLAFQLSDGKLKWRYQVPFNFEIRHAVMSGDLLALAGESETLTLYLGTSDPRGEVVWQEKEEGNLYYPPYLVGDRLVSLRKMPFNLTVRYRSTGKMIGRLELPDLLLLDENPLLETGAKCLPIARDGNRLAVSDGTYYILLDVERMKVVWKRLIDANDPTRLPPLRLELNGDYLAAVKQDFDSKAICMLSSRTGELLWRTDPKVAGSPQPIDTMLIRDGKLYGIKPHPGQGYYFTGLDCQTGKTLFSNEQTGYGGKPEVRLRHEAYGDAVVVQLRDRQDFELKAFSAKTGKLLHKVNGKAAGDFGEHGRASATVQNGRLTLLGKNELSITE